MSLRAILFDAGNTLLFLDYERLAARVSAELNVSLSAAELARHGSAAARALENAKGTDRERGRAFLLLLFELAGVPADRTSELEQALYALHRERHLWSGVDRRTAEALRRLRDAGFRLGVVSNSDGRADEAIEAAGLREYFEFVMDSAEVGVEKPDPRIFMLALERLALTPAEAMYVGDLYEIDAVGARAAGLDVVLVDPAGEHAGRDVRTVRDVAEFAERLLADRAA